MPRSIKTIDFRFDHELPSHLPLAVRSVGEYELVPGSQIEPPVRKWFSEIFWSEKGRGEFALDRRRYQVRDGEIFYLLPGEIHDIRPIGGRWRFHWFTLDHAQSPQWLEAMGFTQRPLPARRCPVDLFHRLREALLKKTSRGDREASHLAHALLLAATEGNRRLTGKGQATWVEQCRRRINESYTDPELHVAAIAREMQVHRATLFRVFTAAYGMTPSRYLQSKRLHRALEALKRSDASIKEIAANCGVKDANYLARLIRRISGVTPRVFRSIHRLD